MWAHVEISVIHSCIRIADVDVGEASTVAELHGSSAYAAT